MVLYFEGSSGQVRKNPIITQMQEDWKRYGFRNREEVMEYTTWIVRRVMADPITSDGPAGFGGHESPDSMLRNYSLNDFRERKMPPSTVEVTSEGPYASVDAMLDDAFPDKE